MGNSYIGGYKFLVNLSGNTLVVVFIGVRANQR